MEYEIKEYLEVYKRSYTKPMYRQLRAKDKGLSLNEFRKLLYRMSLDGKIRFNVETYTDLPHWSNK